MARRSSLHTGLCQPPQGLTAPGGVSRQVEPAVAPSCVTALLKPLGTGTLIKSLVVANVTALGPGQDTLWNSSDELCCLLLLLFRQSLTLSATPHLPSALVTLKQLSFTQMAV